MKLRLKTTLIGNTGDKERIEKKSFIFIINENCFLTDGVGINTLKDRLKIFEEHFEITHFESRDLILKA